MSWSLTKLSVLEHVHQALSSLCFWSWLLPPSEPWPVLPHNPQGPHGSLGLVLVPLPSPLPAACCLHVLSFKGAELLPLSLGYLLGLAYQKGRVSVLLSLPRVPQDLKQDQEVQKLSGECA